MAAGFATRVLAKVPERDWTGWAQSLSDEPSRDPSPFLWLEPGTRPTLDLIFSHTYIPAGKFSLKRDGKASPNWRLYLNCAGNDYYQRGIPGVAASIDALAAWLARIIAGLDLSFIRTIGTSMGGSAALLFGHLLDADRITAIGPEIALGQANDRSSVWNEAKFYDPRFRDLAPILKRVDARAEIVFPAYDVADFGHIRRAQDAGCESALYVHAYHSGGQWLDWPKILESAGDLAFPQDFTMHPRFDFTYGSAALREGEAAFAAICARRFEDAHLRLADLCAAKSNPGLRAQAAAQLCLLGQEDAARAELMQAKEQHRIAYADSVVPPPDAFPSRLVIAAYRHVLSDDEQERLRALFDRRD
jgi:pimeloyl-ACP methyl ester carboxylesterase